MICAIFGLPMARMIAFPLKSSQTSPEVDDINSSSATARFSLATTDKRLRDPGALDSDSTGNSSQDAEGHHRKDEVVDPCQALACELPRELVTE